MIDWNRRSFTQEEFLIAFKEASSIASLARALSLVPSGGTYHSLYLVSQELGLDLKEITARRRIKQQEVIEKIRKPKKKLAELLIKDSAVNSNKLKARLFHEGVFERKCYNCGITEWQGQPAPLELEHKNGNHHDNRLANLTILCPNCHAQTSTYRGRNVASATRDEVKLRAQNTKRKNSPECFCRGCSQKIAHRNSSGFCLTCYKKEKRGQAEARYPKKEVLVNEIATSSYRAVARKYGVSDNALRKHLQRTTIAKEGSSLLVSG